MTDRRNLPTARVFFLTLALVAALLPPSSALHAQDAITGSTVDRKAVPIPSDRLEIGDLIGNRTISLGPAVTLDGNENRVLVDVPHLRAELNADDASGLIAADLVVADIGIDNSGDESSQFIEIDAGATTLRLDLFFERGLSAITGSTVVDPGPSSYRVTLANSEAGESRHWEGRIDSSETGAGSVVTLLLDSSGSMRDSDPDDLRIRTARLLVDHLSSSDRVVVVDFDSQARLLAPANVGGGDRALQEALEQIVEDGETNLTAALEEAASVFKDSQTASRYAILFTDGRHNEGPAPDSMVSTYQRSGWPILTVGLGSQVNDQALLEMARRTGGEYFRAWSASDLTDLFDYVGFELSGNAVISSANGEVAQGQVSTSSFSVDSALETLKVSLAWPGSDLDLTLIGPDDAEYAVDTGFGTEGSTYEIVRVDDPRPGTWTARVEGVDVPSAIEPFRLRAGGSSEFGVNVEHAYEVPPEVGDRVPIRLAASGSIPRWSQLNVNYVARGPQGDTVAADRRVIHSDGWTLDDVFRPDAVGNYYVDMSIEALGSDGGLLFTREFQTSFRTYPPGHFAPRVTRVEGGVLRLDRGEGRLEHGDRLRVLDSHGNLVARARVVSVYGSWSEAIVSAVFQGGPRVGMRAREIDP